MHDDVGAAQAARVNLCGCFLEAELASPLRGSNLL